MSELSQYLIDDLKDLAEVIDRVQGKAQMIMLSGSLLKEAANRIHTLIKAGELLYGYVNQMQCPCDQNCKCGVSDALIGWEDAVGN